MDDGRGGSHNNVNRVMILSVTTHTPMRVMRVIRGLFRVSWLMEWWMMMDESLPLADDVAAYNSIHDVYLMIRVMSIN